MGGHGACTLAIRQPKTCLALQALPARVDIRPFPNNWDIKNDWEIPAAVRPTGKEYGHQPGSGAAQPAN